MFGGSISLYYHENFPSISKLFYEIQYYYRTGKMKEKVEKEYKNICPLETVERRYTMIKNLNFLYVMGKKEELRKELSTKNQELLEQFKTWEIDKYYLMTNLVHKLSK